MFDLSDIGGPKAQAKKKARDRIVLLCPAGENRWQEVDIDKTTAEEFMETIEEITAGGIPVKLMEVGPLSTPIGRNRAIDQIIQLLSFPITTSDLLQKG